jgi:hypothetical protein
MKKIKIEIVYDEDKIGTVIKKEGFTNAVSIESSFELIGALENLKLAELEKIKTLSREQIDD